MSEDPITGATKIQPEKSGGGGKLLLGVIAAAVLLGGGYAAWKTLAPSQDSTEIAYNDQTPEPLRASPLDEDMTADEQADDAVAPPAQTQATTPARRSTARAEAIPEETIGVGPTPINATAGEDDIVVTAPRRPIWARTPTQRRLAALYPENLLERGREGEASLHCIVQEGGALACERVEETSSGFGRAALRVARTFRHSEQLADGANAVGTPLNLRVVFRIDEGQRRGRA